MDLLIYGLSSPQLNVLFSMFSMLLLAINWLCINLHSINEEESADESRIKPKKLIFIAVMCAACQTIWGHLNEPYRMKKRNMNGSAKNMLKMFTYIHCTFTIVTIWWLSTGDGVNNSIDINGVNKLLALLLLQLLLIRKL